MSLILFVGDYIHKDGRISEIVEFTHGEEQSMVHLDNGDCIRIKDIKMSDVLTKDEAQRV